MSLNSILAQTTTTTTRIVQLDQRLLVSKTYNDARGIRTNEDTAALANSLRNNLLTLRHPNIVTLRRVDASNNNSIHITSDFLENAGDLHNILQTRLRSGVYLNEGEVFRIFIQMALGVKYLHDNGIIMGLLHPRNVLVQQSQSHQQNGGLTVRLTDYGAGHVCGGDIARPPNPRASYRPAPSSEPSLSLASDMWSLGIMLYEMIGLTVPFLGIHLEELERRQLSGIVPPLPSGARVRPQVVDLLGMLLNPNPASRPDINDVLGMPLMQKYVHSLVESMASNSTNSSNSTGRKEVTTHPVPVVPVVRVTRRVKQETEKQKVTSRVDLKDINISVNQAEIILSEEEKQLARLRHAREEAHRERLALQQKYQKSPPINSISTSKSNSNSSTVSVRSLGNVQRSPRNATFTPPKPQIGNVQRSPRNASFTPPKPQIGNVQRSPRNATFTPPKPPIVNVQRLPHHISPPLEPKSHFQSQSQSQPHTHVISSPALRRRQQNQNQKDKEHLVLERLKQGRIEAHNERLKLQEKMNSMGMGGRPIRQTSSSSSSPSPSPSSSLEQISPPVDTTTFNRNDRSSRSRSSNSNQVTSNENEAEYLERLRLARIENHRERIALQQRMEGMGGRPTNSPNRSTIPHGSEEDKTIPTMSQVATSPTTASVALKRREREKKTKEMKEKEHLEQLKQARIATHRERIALREKMRVQSGGGGVGIASPTSPRSSPAVAATVARGQARRENSRNNAANTNSKSDEEEYLEQLRIARMEAFDARKRLESRNDEARGFSTRTRSRTPEQQHPTPSPPQQQDGTSEQVLRRKSLQRDKKQAEHEELLREARRIAFEERKALEAKMRNGGRTPGR